MDESRIAKIVEDVSKKIDHSAITPYPSSSWLKSETARRDHCRFVQKPSDVAPLIDHTLLKPDATEEQITRLCDEASEHGFASVCVNPYWVPIAAKRLAGTPVMVCTVIGFPLGATLSAAKADEARIAVESGADELDMVINIGQLKSHRWQAVFDDISQVVEAAEDVPVKVILETALLEPEEIVAASAISEMAGASYVKTSTGFAKGGATVEAVSAMAATVGGRIGVKAAGGIGDFEDAIAMIRAGATRIGASRSIKIVSG